MRRRLTFLVASLPLLAVLGCAPTANTVDTRSDQVDPSSEPDTCTSVPTTDGITLKTGTLTVGTDSPAYDPWFSENDPTNGKGYESAVAYAVADQLGFTRDQVQWVTVPFNTSYKPGAKTFDFDINQISITPEREQVVDFSHSYYEAAQAVIAIKGTPAAKATSLADLKDVKVGAQTGTTSLTAVRDLIAPDQEPAVFKDTSAATQSLKNGQVDAIVADLPTAFYISSAELDDGVIVGQFQPASGEQEQFGMLLAKGSKLTSCVDNALATLQRSGTLADLQQQWLSEAVDVPDLQ